MTIFLLLYGSRLGDRFSYPMHDSFIPVLGQAPLSVARVDLINPIADVREHVFSMILVQ